MTQRSKVLFIIFRLVVLAAMLVALVPAMPQPGSVAAQSNPDVDAPQQQNALTNTIALSVFAARDEPKWGAPLGQPAPGVTQGTPITEYKFIINVDNTGTPDQPRYPDCSPFMDATETVSNTVYPVNCDWPSIHPMQGYSPIVTQGDHTILSDVTNLTLPDGKYLISVTSPDFKIDGQWFTLPMEEDTLGSGVATVQVGMQPLPLPTATIRVKVFEDTIMTNSAPDVPIERGLGGFRITVADVAGEVTTDVYGNPLCTRYITDTVPGPTFGLYIYDADGLPIPVDGSGGVCMSNDNGDAVIPNLGPNRWVVTAIPPDGTKWQLTTTLEGNKDWDTWIQEGYTGFDAEFVTQAEPFPFTMFGFVQPTALTGTVDIPVTGDPGLTGAIKGVIADTEVFVPYTGGLPYAGGLWGGLSGAKTIGPQRDAWVALSDLLRGDQAVYIGQANPDGSFQINGVPDGSYFLGYWDANNIKIFDWVQVQVRNGEVVDMGLMFLTGWFNKIYGHVFVDENENGKMDPGEHGVNGFPLVIKRRENSVMDRGSVATVSDPTGFYQFEAMYPLTRWQIVEFYWDTYRTTGFTYQATNQPTETTILGAGVDVSEFPTIGQSGRLDIGVKQYEPGTNGGIVGSVVYDTTRNELDARLAAVEGWSTGIPGLTVNVYTPVKNPDGTFVYDVDGSIMKDTLINSAVTEQWVRPQGCTVRDVDGNPVDYTQYKVLPVDVVGYDCIEAPLTGQQFGDEFAAVDGNFGFGDGCFGLGGFDVNTGACADGNDPTPLPVGDYLVEVVIPNDNFGRPLYKVTKEEDINVFGGDSYEPQPWNAIQKPDIPPPACAGAMHTVDVAGIAPDGPDAVENPTFVDAGGSPFEGHQKPLCDVKLVTVSDQRSIAPLFTLFTDVPVPGRWFGIILDDLTISTNPIDLSYGEKKGIDNSPIGVYDYSNRLVYTVNSDPNGYFDMLLPSTGTINCPSPSGICANMYRIVGNDPGQPGHINPNWNPQFRTIAASFEVWPGQIIPADLAPTQVGVTIQAPGSQFTTPVACLVSSDTPELFAVDRVYFSQATGGTLTIRGQGFSTSGAVYLDATPMPQVSWSDRQVVVTIPPGQTIGPRQLRLNNRLGKTWVNGITIHILGGTYNPTVIEVGPGRQFNTDTGATVQDAIEFAHGINRPLVVVYPATPAQWNPRGAHYANLIIHSPVRLQGFGPGGTYSDGSPAVLGSVLNGSLFGGDGGTAAQWRALLGTLNWVGPETVAEGAVVTYLAESNTQYVGANFRALLDGFSIEGGDQQGFPNNINQIGGTPTGLPPQVVVQGGAIYAHERINSLRITNNIIQNNGGAYGTVRIGTPNVGDNNNDFVQIYYNTIRANGGTNLAGGVGIFNGADNYLIQYNTICGNFSAEYGGGISHYGYSPNGTIAANRIYFNRSYDEGGGIMIAGELPANPDVLSQGAGPVTVFSNIIQANLAGDDGGGLRYLMAGNYVYNVYNNFITNNVSQHEGGGISLFDAPTVRIYNNTIMKNITTATAFTSTGAPAPAGLSTSLNSLLLQATLPAGSASFSNPLMFNNIFWDNRAGSYDGGTVSGIGLIGDPNPLFHWDVGVADSNGLLQPAYSILQTTLGTIPNATNQIGVDPLVRSTYNTSVGILPWRGNPAFVNVVIVAVEVPATQMGDYHLQAQVSPARNRGVISLLGVITSNRDIDGDVRPQPGTTPVAPDVGADEVGPISGNLLVTPGLDWSIQLLIKNYLPFMR